MSEAEIRARDLRRQSDERNAQITTSLESQRAAVEKAQAAELAANAPPEPCKHGNAIKVEGSKDDARWCAKCGALGLTLDDPNGETQWFPPKG